MTKPDDDATLERPRFDVGPPAPMAYVLEVTDGPDKGLSFVVDDADPSPVLVGQSPACSFRLTDREVSRRHASIEIDGQRLRVVDLGSTNGTFIEGVTIASAFVRSGQTIKLGATSIRLVRRKPGATLDLGSSTEGFGPVLGGSREMRKLHPLFERYAASDLPLVIEGETGTGKELVAETLHASGPRANGPFVVFDCASVLQAQLEAELFGSDVPPAVTGLFERAQGGTLLLDEIAALDVALQPKLLRAIDRGEIVPVGGRRRLRVDVRIIATTNQDLDQAIQHGRFREDLYHRLLVCRIVLPPLRRRHGDVELLARHFARELGGDAAISPLLLSRWLDDAWPGNVRELRNAVARSLMQGDLSAPPAKDPAKEVDVGSSVLRFVDLALDEGLSLAAARQRLVQVHDVQYVEKILAKHGDNVTHAAKAAGVERRYLQILRARKRAK